MTKRPKIAAIVTEFRKYSHGQHIVDRFLVITKGIWLEQSTPPSADGSGLALR